MKRLGILEWLLVLSMVFLLTQLFPSIPRGVVGVLDIRNWSKLTFVITNVAVLTVLLLVQFWRNRPSDTS